MHRPLSQSCLGCPYGLLIIDNRTITFSITFRGVDIDKSLSFHLQLSFTDKYGNEMKQETTIYPFCAGSAETLKLAVNIPSDGIKVFSKQARLLMNTADGY